MLPDDPRVRITQFGAESNGGVSIDANHEVPIHQLENSSRRIVIQSDSFDEESAYDEPFGTFLTRSLNRN